MNSHSTAASQLHRPRLEDLDDVRAAIDEIDDELVTLIHERMLLARAAACAKRVSGRPMRDTRREAEVVRRAAGRARALGVDDSSVRAIFWHLIELSHRSVAAEGSDTPLDAAPRPAAISEIRPVTDVASIPRLQGSAGKEGGL